nr:MAG TPA: hypothetical protein [Caudoviricetes sp.]
MLLLVCFLGVYLIYLYLYIVFSCVTVMRVLQQGSKVVTAPTAKIF